MTDKELIKQEIERLDNKYRELRVSGTMQQAKESDLVVHVLLQISNFIDSLSEEPASKDLEEEIKRYLHEVYDRDTMVGDVARHFANWQKQQMMKDAADGVIHKGLYDSNYIKEQDDDMLNRALKKYNPGDKVKIIIVKEEQQ